MISIENTEVYGWEAAIRGMRNPMNSWDRSDSKWCFEIESCYDCQSERVCEESCGFAIGKNDHDLMMRLAKAGTEHSKYRRMIVVTCDITAPLYWLKEFDTYKVGTVANSCSTMHKIHAKEFTLDDFSTEHMMATAKDTIVETVNVLNVYRQQFLASNDKCYWWQMIQLLPSSYNQKRTVQMNYEVLAAMYKQRKAHKLDEWRDFCDWVKTLPYSEIITLEV